jgi:hypothetical protein
LFGQFRVGLLDAAPYLLVADQYDAWQVTLTQSFSCTHARARAGRCNRSPGRREITSENLGLVLREIS